MTASPSLGRALRALASIDEGRIGDALVSGDLDIDGDMLRPFELRKSMTDVHPVVTVWRFVQPLLFGQVHTNRQAISAHYDIDPDFFLSFLDPRTPCYTQGMYEKAEESLDIATLRKFDYCHEKCRLKPGDHILEIGPGRGAWFGRSKIHSRIAQGGSLDAQRLAPSYLQLPPHPALPPLRGGEGEIDGRFQCAR
jgi:cyclopropane-fatty-acyl-phospholipid synthase